MHPKPSQTVLQRFFAGLTESTFQARLGVAAPPLTDYLSQMLVRFVQSDAGYRFRDLTGKQLTEVVQMIVEG